jgi:hydroxyacylglutathione hydrolase
MKLKALPNSTQVYCAHEYTLSNLKFAKVLEHGNSNLMNYMEKATKLRQQAQATLPSTIGLEKAVNPFLRCEVAEIIANAEEYSGRELDNALDVFAAIRSWKNTF